MSDTVTDSELRVSAIGLLARREYSRAELQQRLQRKASAEQVESVLDRLQNDGYQSDKRFAEVFIRNRISQGQGEIKIRYELRQKGVSDELVSAALQEADPDWFALALSVRERRFPMDSSTDIKTQAKQLRHLVGRGFSYDQARYALSASDIPDFDI
ncbi:regulatory protein RecX [Nitrincola sp. MINF-07-Sa-05]|uniref:regulatory protein RecX n=1 Tax=Nitrincola salilacus TaxID=3400273 RepID=UPI003917F5D7